MPYSIRTKDGIVINNIPDDMPRDSQELKDRVARARSEREQTQPSPEQDAPGQPEWQDTEYGFKVKPSTTHDTGKPTMQREDGALWYGPEQGNAGDPGWFTPKGERAGSNLDPSLWEQIKGGAKYGVQKSILGAQQLGTKANVMGAQLGTVGPIYLPQRAEISQEGREGAAQIADQNAMEARESFQRETGGGIIPTIVSEVVDPVNYIGGVGAGAVGGKATTTLGRIGLSTAKGAISATPAAVLRPRLEGESRLGEAAKEITTSAMATPIMEKVIGPVLAKTINSFRSKASSGAITPAAERFIKDADALGITEYTAGQATGRGPTKSLEATMREIPFLGDKGKLRAGLEQLTRKVQAIDGVLESNMKKAGFGSRQALEDAYAAGDRNARRLIEDVIPKAEDDAYRIIQASADTEKARRSATVSKLYNSVDDMAKDTGTVDVSQTMSRIENMLAENAEYGGNPVLIKELESLQGTLGKTGGYTNTRRLADRIGRQANTLGKKFDSPESKNAAYALRDIRDALRGDMDNHIRQYAPQATDALENATEAYKSLLAPYKSKELRNIIDAANPDETIARMIDKKGVQHAMERIYPNAGEKGQAAIRYAWFNKKLENAMLGGEFSPAKMASDLEKDLGKMGVIFKGKDLEEMQALANVLRAMDNTRLGDAVINNGLRATKWLAGGAAAGAGMAGGAPALGTLAGVGLFAKFLTQGPGKRFLLASKNLPPNSEQMQKLMERAYQQIPRIYGSMEANEPQNQQE